MSFVRMSLPVFLAATVAVSSAQAFCWGDACKNVELSSRVYDLKNLYYIQEPSDPSVITDSETFSVYESGKGASKDPVATFELTNTHQVCCKTTFFPEARSVVRLTMDGQSVDLCAYRPDFSAYTADLSVTADLGTVAVTLSYPSDAGTCHENNGTLISEGSVEDVTSVQLTKELD